LILFGRRDKIDKKYSRSENMDFFKPKIEDYERLKSIIQTDELTCENLFLNALIWQDIYHHEFAFFDDKTVVIRLFEGEGYIYLLPLGESFFPALEAEINMLGEYDRLSASDGRRLDELLGHLGKNIELIPAPENFDYIYNTEELATLTGKKFHQKRNHISAFSRKYNWRYESIGEGNVNDFYLVAEKWASERYESAPDPDIECELRAIKEILPHFKELDILGGIIYVDDNPIAFSFGAPINDRVFDVTTEKALSDFQGAYAVINNSFVKAELFGVYELINREDDLGLEGLKRAKKSYNPVLILNKYLVEIKKP